MKEYRTPSYEELSEYLYRRVSCVKAGDDAAIRVFKDGTLIFVDREIAHHVGHRVVCVGYGLDDDVENISIECERCYTVLYSVDRDEWDGD